MGALTVLFNRIRQVPTARLLGRTSSGTGACESLTAEQVRTLLSLYSAAQIDSALSGKVATDDARLSNAREPTSHGHTQSDITGLESALAGKVGTSDARLSDARTPTTHSHAQSDITGLVAALAAVVDTASANDQAFSGTITWTGTTAPSGTATTRYSWVRVGKLVFFEFRFSWTTNGSSLTAAVWNLPGDMPVPASQTGQDPSEVLLNIVGSAASGQFQIANPGAAVESRLQLDASSVAQARVRFSGTNLGCLSCSGVYRCV